MSTYTTDFTDDINQSAKQETQVTTQIGPSSFVTITALEEGVVFSSHCEQDHEVRYREHQEKPVLQMYFSLEGKSAAYTTGNHGECVLTGRQHILRYTPFFDGYYAISSPIMRNFGVELHEPFFRRLMMANLDSLNYLWDAVEAGRPADISPYPLPLTARQQAVISDMEHCVYTGHMKRLYYESKIVELFLLQAAQADSFLGRRPVQIKSADRDKLYAARHFVEQHVCNPVSLAMIAREVGLNDFKLKKGFRELFGTTVFGYLNELRMHHARHLLLDSGRTVSEVAELLGYNEPHNFSRAFRKYFGYLPGQLKTTDMVHHCDG